MALPFLARQSHEAYFLCRELSRIGKKFVRIRETCTEPVEVFVAEGLGLPLDMVEPI